jgi:CheY-like chemotaxis protein
MNSERAEFTYRILLADDDDAVREVLEALLSQKGYQVIAARDGFQALARMQKALPDIVISDLEMPNMSGFEFLSIVRRRFPQISVIAITGKFLSPDLRNTVLCDAFLEKGDYTPQVLFERIASLLEESPIRPQPVRPGIAPVWIPRNGDYFVLTCTNCLRSFSVPNDIAPEGVGECECLHCGRRVQYILQSR